MPNKGNRGPDQSEDDEDEVRARTCRIGRQRTRQGAPDQLQADPERHDQCSGEAQPIVPSSQPPERSQRGPAMRATRPNIAISSGEPPGFSLPAKEPTT
jgi:hypothetical protein